MEFPSRCLLTGHTKDLKYINSRPMIAASIVKNDFDQDDDSISPFHQPGLPLDCGSLLYYHWTCVHSTSFPGKQIACHSVVSPRLRVVSMLRYGRTPVFTGPVRNHKQSPEGHVSLQAELREAPSSRQARLQTEKRLLAATSHMVR